MIKNFDGKIAYPNVMSFSMSEKIVSAIKCKICKDLDKGKKIFSVKCTFGYNTIEDWEKCDNDIKIIYSVYRSFYDGYDKMILNVSKATLGRLMKIAINQLDEKFIIKSSNKTLVYTLEEGDKNEKN